MIQELLYTSAPKGLKPGSRGFCTVLSTSGMPAPVATALESLSGYRPVFPPGDPQAEQNPVVYSHLKMLLGGRRGDVLSRIADYGLDYSQRTNKIAHHLVIDPNDRPTAGPAWLLAHQEVMRANWNGEPRIVTGERSLPQGKSPLRTCTAWKNLAGDAGWAGVLAESFLNKPDQPAYIIFSPGMDLLSLIEEALALLPPSRRWDVTFSTYFTKIPNGVTCNWRCVLADSPEAKESRRYVQSLRIDLTQSLGKAEGGELVEAARTGRMPASSVLEPAAPSMSEPITSHQEVPPTVGNAPPIRTRDGRAIPHPRQRLSEFPVGYSDVVRKEPYGSWTKWVISIVVLLLIGGGTVAVKQGWVPLNRNTSPVAEKAVSPQAKEVDPNLAPQKPQETTVAEQPKEPQQPDTMVATSISKDGPIEAMKTNPGDAPSPASSSDNTASTQPPAMTASQSAAPAPVPAPPAPTPVDDKPAQTTPEAERPLRITELHWESLPDQLKVDESYEIDLPDWVDPKDAVVSIWCPVDTIKTIQATANIAQVYDPTESQFQDAITATVETKSGTPPSTLRLKSTKPMMFSDFCRIVLNVSHKGNKDQLNILLHKPTRLPSKTFNTPVNSLSLLAPLSWPQESNWKTKVDSLVYSESKSSTVDPNPKRNLSLNGGILSTVFEVECSAIVDLSTIENTSTDLLHALSKTPVRHKIQLLRNSERIEQKKEFEVLIFIDYDEFEKSLKQHVIGKIANFATSPANLGIGPSFPSEPKTITSDRFIKETETYKSHVQGRLDQEVSLLESQKKEAKTKEERDKVAQKEGLIKQLKDDLKSSSDIIAFCVTAQRIVNKIWECQLQELRISQECKNGEKTEYVPIIVYRHDTSNESAVSK